VVLRLAVTMPDWALKKQCPDLVHRIETMENVVPRVTSERSKGVTMIMKI
jgi:hypothetical protein